MAYRIRGPGVLLRTPLGRRHLRYAICDRSGPLLWGLARVYRRWCLHRTRLAAVVGSFGKTTTARALVTALGGSPARLVRANSGGWVALALLRIRPGQRFGVIEVGINGPGQMANYARIVRPDVVVVTSVGSEHHRSLGTLAVTRHEKAEMVRALPPSGLAVLNGDDPNVAWMASQTRARVVTFGFGEGNDVRAGEVRIEWPHGTRFTLRTPTERAVRVRLIGRTMVYPILAAVAASLHEGVSLDETLPALERLEPTPGRLEPVPVAGGAFLLRDDFKSPAETIDAALDVLAEIPAPRRIVVMGDVTEPVGSQRQLYRRLGARTAQVACRAIVLADGDNGEAYRAGARRAGLPSSAVVAAGRRWRRAVEALAADLTPGDVILIKGRDTQRLERVALALMGREVRCDLVYCSARLTRCDACPMLARRWAGLWVADPPGSSPSGA